METYIDIRKSLPGFKLDIKISSLDGVTGILGASGSGKSMLLKCISGLIKPDEGIIVINGRTVFDSIRKTNLAPRERKVGFLFQNYALFNHLTIKDNIAFGIDKISKCEKKMKTRELIDRFHLNDIEMRYPSQISGGQQQRVALARTMAVEPDILLLDEPFSALDTHLKAHMIKDMSSELKGYCGSTIFVTHNVAEAYQLCNKIFVLKAGGINEYGLKNDIFLKPMTIETAQITGYKNILEAEKISENMIKISDWHINVKTDSIIKSQTGFAAIKSNQIKLALNKQTENVFPAWITDQSELPFSTILYIRIGSSSAGPEDYHLEWEMTKEKYNKIKQKKMPINIFLPPEKILFISN